MRSSTWMLHRAVIAVAGLLAFVSTLTVVAGDASAVAATVSLPSLKLHVRIKRTSAEVFGLSEFNILAAPVVATSANGSITSLYYNGQAEFNDAQSSSTYKLVDGVTYYITRPLALTGYFTESVTCLTSSSLPPVKQLLESLNAMTPIAGATGDDTISCPSDKLYMTTLLGEPFVVCATQPVSSPTPGFTIYGANFDVDVVYLPAASVVITKPSISAEQAAACAKTPLTATITDTTLSVLSGVATSNDTATVPRRLKSEGIFDLGSPSCGCKGVKRPCLFVHGMGMTPDMGLVNSSPDYFGSKIESHAPCCSSIKYTALETVSNPWHSDKLQQRLCDLSFQVSKTSSAANKTIADTIIVTHSMGNLMLGGAIATGKCKLAPSSTWVGLSGPMMGSMASDYVQKACAGQTHSLVTSLAKYIGRCPVNPATRSLADQSGNYVTAEMVAKYKAAQAAYTQGVSAAMCSNGNSGLMSTDQPIYKLSGSLLPHKSSENDGIVEYESCRAGIPASQFTTSYTDKFYVTKLNHMDTTFRNGDALFQPTKMPVKWFECLL